MEQKDAVSLLGALAQETRLTVVRHLVKAGPGGLCAGQLAEELEVQPATLSFHLKELEHAGLVHSRREGRQIFYSAGFARVREVIDYLMEDCCQGHPEVCSPFSQRQKESAA